MKPVNILSKYQGSKWIYKSIKILTLVIILPIMLFLFYAFKFEFEKLKQLIILIIE